MTRDVTISWGFALILGALTPLAMAYLGLSVQWGAHPFWDVKTAFIGAGIGSVAALGLAWLRKAWRLVLGLLVVGGALSAATYGKTQFAASFAEDVLAGKLWFFGWIGIAAGLTLIVSEVRVGLRRLL